MTVRYQVADENMATANANQPAPEVTAMWVPGGPRHNTHVDVAERPLEESITDNAGRPIDPYSAKGTDLVRIGAMTTSVENAISLGYLRRSSEGIVRGREALPATQAPDVGDTGWQAPTPAPEKPIAPLSPGAQSLRDTFTSKVGQSDVVGVIVDSLDGNLTHVKLTNIASQLGVVPEEAQALIEALGDVFEDQAARYLSKKHGIPADALPGLFEWATNYRRDGVRTALIAQAASGDMSAYDALAKDYWLHLDAIDEDAILTAEFGSGIKARKVNGKVVVQIPGKGEWLFRAAVQAGLLSFNK